MRPDVLVVGHGLAGAALACELDEHGIDFVVAEAPAAHIASRVAAGLVNPITGRRLVKSWRVDQLLPLARAAYDRWAERLGRALWHDVKIRRLFADEHERAIWAEKQSRGEIAAYARGGDAEGFWIEPAGWVDVTTFLDAARARWQERGSWSAEPVEPADQRGGYATVIDCRGLAGAHSSSFAFVPWEYSKGEVLNIEVCGLEPAVVRNRREWVLPLGDGRARVGATHEPHYRDVSPSVAGRDRLESAARELIDRPFVIHAQQAGVRVTLPDKHPVVGRHPGKPDLGLVNGLGGKGVLLAPWLARQWAAHLEHGTPFDSEVDVARFHGGPGGR